MFGASLLRYALSCVRSCGRAVQVFFCKYNDPIYVKMEKLEIMIQLASERNIDQVLLEFKEYAQEVDVDFVRKVRGGVLSHSASLHRA
jgi:vesicle coat complex subunit